MRRVNFEQFLAPVDTTRVRRVLEKSARSGLDNFALTGGLALEAQIAGLGRGPRIRSLNDVDIVVESFASVPAALAETFLVRHVHPQAPEGKILVQLVDPHECLRIDVFRACGATIERSHPLSFGSTVIKVVSLEDLAARTGRLLMDIEHGAMVARKNAEDFKSLLEFIHLERVEAAWQDHRKASDPLSFKDSSTRLLQLIQFRGNLLVDFPYSRDVDAICPMCREVEPFRLASPRMIMSILGYC